MRKELCLPLARANQSDKPCLLRLPTPHSPPLTDRPPFVRTRSLLLQAHKRVRPFHTIINPLLFLALLFTLFVCLFVRLSVVCLLVLFAPISLFRCLCLYAHKYIHHHHLNSPLYLILESFSARLCLYRHHHTLPTFSHPHTPTHTSISLHISAFFSVLCFLCPRSHPLSCILSTPKPSFTSANCSHSLIPCLTIFALTLSNSTVHIRLSKIHPIINHHNIKEEATKLQQTPTTTTPSHSPSTQPPQFPPPFSSLPRIHTLPSTTSIC